MLRFEYSDTALYKAHRVLRFMYSDGGLLALRLMAPESCPSQHE